MNVGTALPADAQTAKLVQPAQASLHHPARRAQAAAVFGAAASQHRGDPPLAQLAPMRLGIVRAVALHAVRPLPGPTRLPGDGRNLIHQRQQLGHVVTVRRGERERQREALRVGEQVVFRAATAAVRGIAARVGPPFSARSEALSTTARDQSIWSAPRSSASSLRRIRSHTPARCQSRSRRQHVIPEQPISRGRYSHGMPVRSTNKMPLSATRFGTGLRPGYRRRRRLGGGKCGSSSSHNPSSKIGFAMTGPPCPAVTMPIGANHVHSF